MVGSGVTVIQDKTINFNYKIGIGANIFKSLDEKISLIGIPSKNNFLL